MKAMSSWSSLSLICICTGGSTTIWFQGTKTVRVSGRNGDRWNCSVTAPPPFTSTSNQPPWRVSVKPKRESRSTDTRIPMMPSPCGVTTWPRITDTRTFSIEASLPDCGRFSVLRIALSPNAWRSWGR
uniref:Putative secreted protein n=1 Tax=Anopheles darlingi TaxID=43151 RepID=A0A2M4DF32_ANODA